MIYSDFRLVIYLNNQQMYNPNLSWQLFENCSLNRPYPTGLSLFSCSFLCSSKCTNITLPAIHEHSRRFCPFWTLLTYCNGSRQLCSFWPLGSLHTSTFRCLISLRETWATYHTCSSTNKSNQLYFYFERKTNSTWVNAKQWQLNFTRR